MTALDLPLPPRESLPPDLQKYFRICDEKIGFLPNVLAAYTFDEKKLRAFIGFYNELMLEDSPLSKLEREMIAVVVSSANRCYYCQVAHGQAVRELSGDPALGELLVMNYRAAALTPRQREILQLIAEGRSAKEIASSLSISSRTVEFHKYQMMETLGLHTNAELIHFAIKHGLIEL